MSIAGRTIYKVNSWATPDFDIKDPSLVLYLPLWYPDSETTGSTIISKDINRRSCSVTGAALGSQGRYFDGDDYINISDAPSLNPIDAITIMEWINPTSFGTDYTCPLGKGANEQWYFRLGTASQLISIQMNKESENIWRNVEHPTALVAGTWYHLVATYDGATMAIYLNTVKATNPHTGTIGVIANPLYIGNNATFWYFNGPIGEARIYNQALTAGEVMNDYLATKWRYQ